MGIDWNAEQVTLEPQDLDKMENKVFIVARQIEPRMITSNEGKSFKLYDFIVESSDGKLRSFSVFAGDLEPVTKLIQTQNLKGQAGIKEIGIRLTLECQKYKKKDKTDAVKVAIVKVEPPSIQASLS